VDHEKYFANRLAQLRIKAGVSARDMSLSMGQSQGYINKIESGQNLPSMTGFFYICEYFGITPMEFFDEEASNPQRRNAIIEKMAGLTDKQLCLVESLIDEMVHSG